MKQKTTKKSSEAMTVDVDIQRIAIVDCEKLNIRKEATLDNNNIIGVAVRNEILVIDMDKSNNEFYKVVTESGLDGYCKIEFVKLTD